jgi:hypothetical protein
VRKLGIGARVRLDGNRTGFVSDLEPDGVTVQLNDGLGPAFQIFVSMGDIKRRLELLDD